MLMDALDSVKTRNPLRVFAVFAVGIILPSGFLSYLGMRSFQYEGALLQKQTEERYATVADVSEKKVGDQLSDLVSALAKLGRHPAVEALRTREIIPILLETTKLNGLPLRNLYVFDDQDQMVAPWSQEPTRGYDGESPREINWGPWSEEVERLDHLEFVDKNVALAVEGYLDLEKQHMSPTLQAQLLKSIADGYHKLGQTRQAEASYLKLARDFDGILDTSGWPMGILARQLLIRLYDQHKDTNLAFDTRMDILEGLVGRHWILPASREETLTGELQNSLAQALSRQAISGTERPHRLERLQALKNRLAALRTDGHYFAAQVWPTLTKRLRQRGWVEQGGVLEVSAGKADSSVAIVAPILSSENGRRRGSLVAIVDGNLLWPMMERTLNDYAQPVGLQISWDHTSAQLASRNKSDRELWKSRVERQVNGIDPPLHFRLSEASSQEQSRLSRRRLWIYGGMIGLSFVVIVVGLVVMRQAVKREMEVANLKADFVANVSHELRTPLTTISYVGERLNLGRYRTEEERQKFYGMLDRETHRLKDLIEDVLDFSKMLAGKKVYRQESIELAPLVQEAYERFQGKARAKDFEVLLDLPPEDVTITGDRKALMQTVLNLMDNAVKYSGQSRRIQVKVLKTLERAIIAVQDFGIGISEQDREKIFEKFYRVEQGLARDTEGGVGLGLAMVKHVVEGHGGTIRVQSRLGEGSTFLLEFPLHR